MVGVETQMTIVNANCVLTIQVKTHITSTYKSWSSPFHCRRGRGHFFKVNRKNLWSFFNLLKKLPIRIYVTSEQMVQISSVLPFWKPQNVSSNLGYLDLPHAKTRTRDRRLCFCKVWVEMIQDRHLKTRFKCETRGK